MRIPFPPIYVLGNIIVIIVFFLIIPSRVVGSVGIHYVNTGLQTLQILNSQTKK